MTETGSHPNADDGEETGGDWPIRRLRDAGAVKAMAHPLRLRLVELLGTGGPATATELAAKVEESPANCSWHLRQLAAHGFIEETGQGRGRQRYWRFVPERTDFGHSTDDPELAAAGEAGGAVFLEYVIGELRQWRADRAHEPDEWKDAAFSSNAVAWLTADELAAMSEEIVAVFTRHLHRLTDPAARPPGARPVRLYATGMPARALEDRETDPD